MSSEHQSPSFFDRLLPALLRGLVLPGAAVFLAIRAYSNGFVHYTTYFSSSTGYSLTGTTLNIHIAHLLCGAIFLNAYYFWYNLFPHKTLILYVSRLFIALTIILSVALVVFLP